MASNRLATGFNILPHVHELYTLSEHLAHNLAYKSWLVDGYELNLDDNKNLPYVVKQVDVAHGGLYCFILKPKPECKSKEVYILFRGTKCTDSIFRDIEPGAAGASSIAEALPLIIKEINNTIDEIYSHGLNITVCGHSLGGADTQNCFVALMKEAETNRSHFHKVKQLTLVAFNAAGVTQQVAVDAEIVARKLQPTNTKIKCYWLHAAGDIVQQTGQATILAGVGPDIAEVHLVKAWMDKDAEVKSYLELLWVFNVIARVAQIHTSYYFRADMKNKVELQYYNNSTPEGREIISKKLSKKINFLQYFNFRFSQHAIMRIREYFNHVALEEKQQPNKQLIHVKQDSKLLDFLMNATDISLVFDRASFNGMPEIRIHVAPQRPAIERLDRALVPFAHRPTERVLAIALPMVQALLQQQQRYLSEHQALPDDNHWQLLLADRVPLYDGMDEQKQGGHGRVLDGEEKGDNGLQIIIDEQADILGDNHLIAPNAAQHPSFYGKAIVIGAMLGVLASIALAILVPPVIPFAAALLHLSASTVGVIIGVSAVAIVCAAIGSLLGAAVARIQSLTSKIANAEYPVNIDDVVDNEHQDQPAPSSTFAHLHRQHDIRIQANAHAHEDHRSAAKEPMMEEKNDDEPLVLGLNPLRVASFIL